MEKNNGKKSVTKKYLKYAFIFLLVAVAFWIISGYVKSELADRAVVLGIGIDYQEEVFEVTAEVISPGQSTEGGSQVQSKLLVGRGETVPLAIQDIYQTSGKNPSLGQTGFILLGEGMKQQDLRQVLSYFVFSDAFKDGVTVAMCDGTARKIFETTSPLDNMISYALQSIIQQSGQKTNSISNFLQNFIEKQMMPSETSFLSEVRFVKELVPESDKGESDTKTLGVYDCAQINIFKNGRYTGTLSKDETRGFIMMDENMSYDNFVVEDAEGDLNIKGKISIGIASKDAGMDVKMQDGKPTVKFSTQIKLRKMKTDVSGNVMDYLPKTPDEVSGYIKDNVKKQVEELVNAAIEKCVEIDCDYFEIANKMFKTYGNKWKDYQKENPDYLQKTQFSVEIKIID